MPDSDARPVVLIDCEEGRRLGCATYCCRLIVRLEPGEVDPGQPDNTDKRCIDKDPVTGLCVYFDTETNRCRIWDQRPAVCRGFDCNKDPLLPLVLEFGFKSLVDLVTRSTKRIRPEATRVPRLDPDPDDD